MPQLISPARDRLQSRLLLGLTLPFLAVLALEHLLYAGLRAFTITLLIISLTFAAVVWLLRAATLNAALTGALICFLIGLGTGYFDRSLLFSGLLPLLTLFLLTFAATRLARPRTTRTAHSRATRTARLRTTRTAHSRTNHPHATPVPPFCLSSSRDLRLPLPSPVLPPESESPLPPDQRGLAEARHGRNTAQIIANLGVAAFAAGLRPSSAILFDTAPTVLLAALAEATADTVSSELGSRFGGTPILLTTLRPVPPGTDGAISLLGTAAGILAAALVTLTGAFALSLNLRQSAIALLAATAGLFFDSLLGATLEPRALLNNDLVNFLSTLFAAALALLLCLLPN